MRLVIIILANISNVTYNFYECTVHMYTSPNRTLHNWKFSLNHKQKQRDQAV